MNENAVVYFFIATLLGVLFNLYAIDTTYIDPREIDSVKISLSGAIIVSCLLQLNANRIERADELKNIISGQRPQPTKLIQRVLHTISSLKKRKGGFP